MAAARLWMAMTLLAGGLAAVAVAPPAFANSGTITPNGAPVTATITGPSDSATFTFTGRGGQEVNLTADDGTFAAGCDASVQIDDSYGRTIAGSVCVGVANFLGSVLLPASGTYLVEVLPNDSDTGQVRLQLSMNAADSTITENGPAVTFTAAHAGQGRNYSFAGTAGDVVNLSASGGTYAGGCDVSMSVLAANGRVLAGSACAGTSQFLGSVDLPGTGTYVVQVSPNVGDTGHVRLQLSKDVADGKIRIGGTVTFTANHSGQGRNLVFSATGGESINVSTAGNYPGGCDVGVAIADTYGRTLAGQVCAGDLGSLDDVVLPGNGKYTLEIIPNNGDTGSMTVGLADTPPPGP